MKLPVGPFRRLPLPCASGRPEGRPPPWIGSAFPLSCVPRWNTTSPTLLSPSRSARPVASDIPGSLTVSPHACTPAQAGRGRLSSSERLLPSDSSSTLCVPLQPPSVPVWRVGAFSFWSLGWVVLGWVVLLGPARGGLGLDFRLGLFCRVLTGGLSSKALPQRLFRASRPALCFPHRLSAGTAAPCPFSLVALAGHGLPPPKSGRDPPSPGVNAGTTAPPFPAARPAPCSLPPGEPSARKGCSGG